MALVQGDMRQWQKRERRIGIDKDGAAVRNKTIARLLGKIRGRCDECGGVDQGISGIYYGNEICRRIGGNAVNRGKKSWIGGKINRCGSVLTFSLDGERNKKCGWGGKLLKHDEG